MISGFRMVQVAFKDPLGFVSLAVLVFQALRCAALTVQQLAASPFFAKRQGYDHLLLYGVEFLGFQGSRIVLDWR